MWTKLRQRIAGRFFGPEIRQAARSGAQRGYNAARITSQNSKFFGRTSIQTSSQIFETDASRLRQLCRQAYMDVEIVRSIVEYNVERVVGANGPRLQVNTEDKELNNRIEKLWKNRCRNITLNGSSFSEALQTVVRERWCAGESFIVFNFEKSKAFFEIVEPEQLDSSISLAQNYLARGIEYDTMNRPINYHIGHALPGTGGYLPNFTKATTYDADRVSHFYVAERGTSLRGFSPLASSLNIINVINDIDEAELDGKRKEAYFSVHLKPSDEFTTASDVLDAVLPEESETSTPEQTKYKAEMGGIYSGNYDVQVADPKRPGSSYLEFTGSLIKRVCAACNAPYSAIVGDASGSSYSAESSMLNHYRKRWISEQNVLENRVVRPMFEFWLRNEGLALGLSLNEINETLESYSFAFERFEYFDRRAEAQAQDILAKSGIKSIISIMKERGDDPETELDNMKKFIEMCKERGIPIPGEGQTPTTEPSITEDSDDATNDEQQDDAA